MMRRHTAILLAVVLMVCSACSFTLQQGTSYEADLVSATTVEATIYEEATNQLAVLYDAICHDNMNPCTVNFINANVHIQGWGATQWHNAVTYDYFPLQVAIIYAIQAGALNNWNIGGPCVKLVYWLIENYAWRLVGAGGSCKVGQPLVSG